MKIEDFFTSREKDILDGLRPIMEQRMEIDDGFGNSIEVNVFRNVSAQSLVQLTLSSRMKQVRGLANGRDIYFWDAYYANHDQVARALGIEYKLENRIHVWVNGHSTYKSTAPTNAVTPIVCVDFLDRPMGDYPETFAMRRLLTSPNIFFDSRAGYISGPEMLHQMAA